MSVIERNGRSLPAVAEAWTGIGESWFRQSEAWLDRASRAGMTAFRPSGTAEELYGLTDRLTEVNLKYVEDLMGAWLAATTAVVEHVSGLTSVFNEGLRSVSDAAA